MKAAVQGVLSRVPAGPRLNSLLQQYATRTLQLSVSHFESKLHHSALHLERYRATANSQSAPSAVIEIGTGWYPIIPIALYLSGCDRVDSYDIYPLATDDRLAMTLRRFASSDQSGRLRQMLPDVVPERLQRLSSMLSASATPREVFEGMNVHLVVADIQNVRDFPRNPDLVTSNNTLEHIPANDMLGVLEALRRCIAADGVMDHFVDMSDHYAHFDRRISQLNFLRFSDARWRLFNNSLQYQNRLRLGDYVRVHNAAQFCVTSLSCDRVLDTDLDSVSVSPKFARYPRDELLVVRCSITSVPDPSHTHAVNSALTTAA